MSHELSWWEQATTAVQRAFSNRRMLKENFLRYGKEMGVRRFEEFERMARDFFVDGLMGDGRPDWVVVELSGGRLAIDHNGEKRGIFLRDGTPLAFFKPDFRAEGFATRRQELEAFRNAAGG